MGKTEKQQSTGKQNGLSWIYRRKVKLRKTKNVTQDKEANVRLENSGTKIVVRNLSFKAKEEDVRKLYEKYGEIQEIILPRQPNGTLFGYGFIEFKRMQDASKAIFNTNKREFFGRTIISAWAIENSKFCEKVKAISETNDKDKNLLPSINEQFQDKSSKESAPAKRKRRRR